MKQFMQYTGWRLTQGFEGCKLVSYRDVRGVLTIGYGHTTGVRPGQTCTVLQAQAWLASDIAWAVSAVNNLVEPELTQGEFDALVDFVYNVGRGAFAASTMLKLLNAGDFVDAADEFTKWDESGGHVVAGLLRRREAEKEEFDHVPTAAQRSFD